MGTRFLIIQIFCQVCLYHEIRQKLYSKTGLFLNWKRKGDVGLCVCLEWEKEHAVILGTSDIYIYLFNVS